MQEPERSKASSFRPLTPSLSPAGRREFARRRLPLFPTFSPPRSREGPGEGEGPDFSARFPELAGRRRADYTGCMNDGFFDYATLAALLAIVAFLWSLHRDIGTLRDRISRLEGAVDLLANFLMDRDRGRAAAE